MLYIYLASLIFPGYPLARWIMDTPKEFSQTEKIGAYLIFLLLWPLALVTFLYRVLVNLPKLTYFRVVVTPLEWNLLVFIPSTGGRSSHKTVYWLCFQFYWHLKPNV